ncbi:Uridylate kinase [Candidatus Arsenophonus lipoptenae]|uniref:Uridylate kinase n=1 Tax=Candidatus Arsenophonus lipoptenae TaxID=634113 RepID=A0A109QE12_9GAMM|nr:UMP kinase [Candidatus Arsenophonus lipoptenae]AMA64621.1 Uridylate kinase [Candidatus Arsenophonus lipoptenae]
MIIDKRRSYKRILLKISGEALQGSDGINIDANNLNRIAQEIKDLIKLSIQVGVVIGGGNLFRGSDLANNGMNQVISDHMGMLATIINGLAMRDALHRLYVNANLMSAVPLNGICDSYSWIDAIKLLRDGKVVIFSAGTGNAYFTTDLAACLRGIEIKADIVLKGTKVDGVYSSDPSKSTDAILYKKLTYQEVLNRKLKVMDLTSFTLARDHNLPIRIFNINKPGTLGKIIIGENKGTLIVRD